jgi:hypothetical protein
MTRNHYRLVCELEESEATLSDLGASIERNDAVIAELGPLVKYVCQPKALWYKTKPASELILVENDGRTEIGLLSEHSALLRSINFGYLRFVYADKPDVDAARRRFKEVHEQHARLESNRAEVGRESTPSPTIASPSGTFAEEVGPQSVLFDQELQSSLLTARPVQSESAAKKELRDAI